MNITDPIIASLLLACSVLSGGILVMILQRNSKEMLNMLLTFSGAFLLGISALHLIPEVFELAPFPGVFMLLGFLIQILAESLSKGVEHGHMHGKKVFPVTILIGLFVHTYIEAVPIGGLEQLEHTTEVSAPHTNAESTSHKASLHRHNHSGHAGHDHSKHNDTDPHVESTSNDSSSQHHHGHHHHMGTSFIWGVIAHKVPMAFALMALMMQAGTSRSKRIFWLLIFALSGPLGVFTGSLITGEEVLYALLAVALGSFLHVSTTIILEGESSHKINLRHLSLVVIGFFLAWGLGEITG